MTAYTLIKVIEATDWQAYNHIREKMLWLNKGRTNYKPGHKDEFLPQNTPLILKLNHVPIGTTRLDNFGDGTGCIRLVAIIDDYRGQGHGRVLSNMVEALAKQQGIATMFVNAAPDALGYYQKLGYAEFSWNRSELVGISADCIQMQKIL